MTDANRLSALRIVLRVLAAIFVVGIYPLTEVWPDGWSWSTGHSDYLQMILGIYATLGVFLWIAARDPERHRSLIAFAIWSSIVHGAIMAAQSLGNPMHMGHLYGDVAALFIAAGALAYLAPGTLWLRTTQA